MKRKSNQKRQEQPYKEIPHELSIILLHLESRFNKNEILTKGMIPLVCENLLCGASSPNVVTGCPRKLFKWVNNSRQRV